MMNQNYPINNGAVFELLKNAMHLAEINRGNLKLIQSLRRKHPILNQQNISDFQEPSCKRRKVTSNAEEVPKLVEAKDDFKSLKSMNKKSSQPLCDWINVWKYDGEQLIPERIVFDQFIDRTLEKFEDLVRLNNDYITLCEKYFRLLTNQFEALEAARVLLLNLKILQVAIKGICIHTLDAQVFQEGNESTIDYIKNKFHDYIFREHKSKQKDNQESQIVQFRDLAKISCKHTLSHRSSTRVWGMKSLSLSGMQYLACALDDNDISIWDLKSQSVKSILSGHDERVHTLVSYEHEGVPMLASGSSDKSIILWNLSNNSIVATLSGHSNLIAALATFSFDGRTYLVSGSKDSTIKMWDLEDYTVFATFEGHGSTIMSLAIYFVDGNPYLASGGFDGTIKIWNLRTQLPVTTISGNGQYLRSLVVTERNGKMFLACGYHDGVIEVWDLENTTFVVLTSVEYRLAVTGLEVVRFGNTHCLVSSDFSGNIKFWNLKDNSMIFTLKSNRSVTSLTTLKIGEQACFVTGRTDGKLQIWKE